MSAYLVIARKWRPALFSEVVGQAHVTRTLTNAVASGRISQAFLFSGPRGVGKTTAARILAKCLNCEKGPTPTPCNECTACRSITGGSSVDVFEIDGASNTSVDNVRELRESVKYMPSTGRYKVYIIDEVHMLSTSAFNALLKTLEEPPAHAVFIFATTEVHKIPLTILSRCQRFDFKRIPFAEIQAHLEKIVTEEGLKVEGAALSTISREADGSLRDAQSLLEQVVSFSESGVIGDADVATALGLMDRSVLFELLEAVVAKDAPGCLNIVEKIYDFGYDLKKATGDLVEAVRDLTVLKVTAGAASSGAGDAKDRLLELSDDELKRMRALAERVGVERLHMLFNVISAGYEDVSRSAYPRYSLEMAILRAVHFDDLRPVPELLERVEKLARTLGGRSSRSQGANAERPSRADGARRPDFARGAKAPGKAPAGMATEARDPGGGQPGPGADTEPVEVRPAAAAQTARAEEATGGYGEPGGSPGASGDPDALADFLKVSVRSLVAALADSTVTVNGDTVEIAVTPESYNAFCIKKEQLKKVSSEYLGRTVNIDIKPGGGAAGEEKPGENKKAADPLIQEAKRLFGGKVIEDGRRTNV